MMPLKYVVLGALLVGCVTRVTVCATYDHRLGRETPERYAKDSIGTSVCADAEPPVRDE